MACLLAGITHERHLAQGFLHHPLKVAPEVTIYPEDVHRTLVVGHKHIALLMVDVFPPLHLDGQQQDVADELRPNLAGIITPKVRAAYETADNRDEGCEHGGDERQGQSDEKLIDYIKEVHNPYNRRKNNTNENTKIRPLLSNSNQATDGFLSIVWRLAQHDP